MDGFTDVMTAQTNCASPWPTELDIDQITNSAHLVFASEISLLIHNSSEMWLGSTSS